MSFPLASVAAPDLLADPEIVDGRRTYLVRARIPFAFSAMLNDAHVEQRAKAKAKADTTEEPDSPTNPGDQKVVTKADGEEDVADPMSTEGDNAAEPGMTEPVLYGIASSTGVDTYGTEMSKRALDGMAAQFSSGEVCYLPAHPSWSGGGGEWDSVIGYVTKGEVVSGAVENAADGSEPGFVLRVEVTLDPTCEKTDMLCKRIEQKRKIGQSIGGWFTELRYIYAKDAGEWDPPERVIIEGVELDHLAATRRPSNGDSWIDGMRSAISTAHDLAVTRAKAKQPTPAPVVEAPTERNDVAPLDTENAPRQDSPDDAGSEGHRASPGATEDGTPPPTPTEEPQMTEAELRAALEGSLKAALAPIAARLDAVEARTAVATPPGERAAAHPEPKPAGDSAEVIALRERLAAVERTTANSYFARKGHAGAGSFDRAIVKGVAEKVLPEVPSLAAVVRSNGFVERRDVDHYGADIQSITAMRTNLESDLSALINSACDDGVIRDPDSEIGTWA